MSDNPAERGIDNRLVEDINYLKRTIRELKTTGQYSGGDSILFSYIPTAGPLQGNFVVPAGQTGFAIFQLNVPDGYVFGAIEVLYDIYVDARNGVVLWPAGTAISAGQSKLTANIHASGASNKNVRFYYLTITNLDTVTHNYFYDVRFIMPAYKNVTATVL